MVGSLYVESFGRLEKSTQAGITTKGTWQLVKEQTIKTIVAYNYIVQNGHVVENIRNMVGLRLGGWDGDFKHNTHSIVQALEQLHDKPNSASVPASLMNRGGKQDKQATYFSAARPSIQAAYRPLGRCNRKVCIIYSTFAHE